MAADFDVKALYSALERKRVERELTWSGVAKEIEERYAKVSASTIKSVGTRTRVEGDGVLQMLLWLGRTPESFVPGFEGSREQLRVPNDAKVLRWDTAAIFREVDRKRDGGKLNWNEVADQIGGITSAQLKGLRKGGRTFFPEVMRIVLWLEIPAGHLTRESDR